jgi:hypothetical protein
LTVCRLLKRLSTEAKKLGSDSNSGQFAIRRTVAPHRNWTLTLFSDLKKTAINQGMQEISVTFDQVMHVHRNSANRSNPKHTLFTFISDGVYFPYVKVFGWPNIDIGTKVTALLRKPNDWKSLAGWVNQESLEIAAPKKNARLKTIVCMFLITCFQIFLFKDYPKTLVFIIFVMCVISIFDYFKWQKEKEAAIILDEIAERIKISKK